MVVGVEGDRFFVKPFVGALRPALPQRYVLRGGPPVRTLLFEFFRFAQQQTSLRQPLLEKFVAFFSDGIHVARTARLPSIAR